MYRKTCALDQYHLYMNQIKIKKTNGCMCKNETCERKKEASQYKLVRKTKGNEIKKKKKKRKKSDEILAVLHNRENIHNA